MGIGHDMEKMRANMIILKQSLNADIQALTKKEKKLRGNGTMTYGATEEERKAYKIGFEQGRKTEKELHTPS